MDTLEILVAARAEVVKGWCRGAAVDFHGNVCALGAVDVALGCERTKYKTIATAVWDREDVFDALQSQMEGPSVVSFNDTPSTTKADVLALFDRAIAAEAVAASPDPAHTFAVA